MAYNIFN